MSFDALAWAAKQDTGSSGTKLVLLGLAECADRLHGLAFPSVAALTQFSCLDRKSVIGNLAKLETAGLISDTGRRVGATKQIKVYKLSIPETGQSQIRNGSDISDKAPENGTRNKSKPVTQAKACERVLEVWNEKSKVSRIPAVRVLNNSRKQMLVARLKEHGLEAVLEAVCNIHNSAFCRGERGDGRTCDIMLLLQPKTFARALESFYNQDGDKAAKPKLNAEQTRNNKLARAAWLEQQGQTDEAEQVRREAAALIKSAVRSLAA